MTKKNLLITFSGGETSALMTILLLNVYRANFNEVLIVFCNTSQENDETLDFVDRVSKHYGFETIWLEAVTHLGERKGCTHRVVTYETANRNGEVFEKVIEKYGIPNKAYPHCTRALKLEPITSYLKSIGWVEGEYVRAIGIRFDEPRRIKEKVGVIYPLVQFDPLSKRHVNEFWGKQQFRLNLTGYQGNCKTCWKKSLRKLMTIMDESPEHFEFFDKMERLHGNTNTNDPEGRTFWREKLSTDDMREVNKQNKHNKAEDDSIIYFTKVIELDMDDGCSESCEAIENL